MVGIELVKDRTSKEPAKEATQRVGQLAAERGLLTITAGTYGNVIRTLMPLVIGDDELEEGLDVLQGALAQVDRRFSRRTSGELGWRWESTQTR